MGDQSFFIVILCLSGRWRAKSGLGLMGWMVFVGQCSSKSTFGANKSQESESRSLPKQNPYSCLLFVLCHPVLETDSGKSWQQCVAIFCEVNFKLASSTPCCSPVVYAVYILSYPGVLLCTGGKVEACIF